MNEIIKRRIDKAAEAIAPFNRMSQKRDYFVKGCEWMLSNQWISSEEASPPKEGIILARLSKEFSMSDNAIEVVYWHKGFDIRHGDGFYDVLAEEVPVNAITHWMPIPDIGGKL